MFSTLYFICLTLSFFKNIIIVTFSWICFLLSSMGKCTSSVDPYDHYYICRSFYVDINFQPLDSIRMLNPEHVIILINVLQITNLLSNTLVHLHF